MAPGKDHIDFDTRKEADSILRDERNALRTMKALGGFKPIVSIHEHHHNDGGRCVNWEYFEKD